MTVSVPLALCLELYLQFFIHRQFGYRGVIVSKWSPKVFSYPDLSSHDVTSASLHEAPKLRDVGSAVVHDQNYYQVFCDTRDTQEMVCFVLALV